MSSPSLPRKSIIGRSMLATLAGSSASLPSPPRASTPAGVAPSPPQLAPINGLFMCRIKSANGTQSDFSPYSVVCSARANGVCALQFDTNDGADLAETRIFSIPSSRKVRMRASEFCTSRRGRSPQFYDDDGDGDRRQVHTRTTTVNDKRSLSPTLTGLGQDQGA